MSVAGKVLAELPRETWITLEIACPVGESVAGQWTLRVHLPEGQTLSFDSLPIGSARFGKLTWIGWCSMATKPTQIYLDRVILQNQSQ